MARTIVALQRRRVDAGEDAPTDLNASQTRASTSSSRSRDASGRSATPSGASRPRSACRKPRSTASRSHGPNGAIRRRSRGRSHVRAREKRCCRVRISPLRSTITPRRKKSSSARSRASIRSSNSSRATTGITASRNGRSRSTSRLPMFNRNEGEIAEAKAAREVAGRSSRAAGADLRRSRVGVACREGRRDNLDAARRRNESMRQQLAHADAALKASAPATASSARTPRCSCCAPSSKRVQAARARQAARNALEDALHAPLSGPELALAKAWTSRILEQGDEEAWIRDSGCGIRGANRLRRACRRVRHPACHCAGR